MATSRLVANEKQVVTPGEVIAEGIDFLPSSGTYRYNNEIRSNLLGLVQTSGKVIRVIPLSGRYSPKKNDIVIARVVDINLSGWRLEINSAYQAMLGLKDGTSEFIPKGADLSQFYALGDYIVCQIVQVTTQKLVDVTMRGPGLRKLKGGQLIQVNPHKVPRIIGKKGSMVELVKKYTNTRIIVGQNGLVWISGDDVKNIILATMAIKKIEEESHISGLTERIKTYLEQATSQIIGEKK